MLMHTVKQGLFLLLLVGLRVLPVEGASLLDVILGMLCGIPILRSLCRPEVSEKRCDCRSTEFCDYDYDNGKAGSSCSPIDDTGTPATCVTIPTTCPAMYSPVCGCDGKTYDNDCARQAASVQKRANGECCQDDASCALPSMPAMSMFCHFRPGTCRDPSGGVCTAMPFVCTIQYDPVCGCDGITYGNDCARQQAGVSKSSHGPCQ
jgi:Kazal-type serine protease inhibitor domain